MSKPLIKPKTPPLIRSAQPRKAILMRYLMMTPRMLMSKKYADKYDQKANQSAVVDNGNPAG